MPKLEKITWLDHAKFSNSRWREKAEMSSLDPVKLETIGWVVKETKEYLVIVNTRSKGRDDHYNNEFCIVKGAILKRKELA